MLFPGIDVMVEDKMKACLPSHDYAWPRALYAAVDVFSSRRAMTRAVSRFHRTVSDRRVTNRCHRSGNCPFNKQQHDDSKAGRDICSSRNSTINKKGQWTSIQWTRIQKLRIISGFTHRRVTPLWPGANDEVERFRKTLGKAIRSAFIEQHKWKQELYTFLRQYRATPHYSTGVSPSQLLNGRQMTVLLSQVYEKNPQRREVENRDAREKSKMKKNADERRHESDSQLCVGDTVLVRQTRKNKMSAAFDPRSLKVSVKKKNIITASRGNYSVPHNVSHCKVLPRVRFDISENDQLHDDYPRRVTDHPNDEAAAHVNVPQRPARRVNALARFRDFVMD